MAVFHVSDGMIKHYVIDRGFLKLLPLINMLRQPYC